MHYYRGGIGAESGEWLVDALVDTRDLCDGLRRLGVADDVPRINCGGEFIPEWIDGVDVPIEDERMWYEAQALMV